MESLGKEKVRPMGNIAPKRAFDQVKQDPRPTSRWGRKTFQEITILSQPAGRAEGESETQDRQEFLCKLTFFSSYFSNSHFLFLLEIIVILDTCRYSAKEGGRSDAARPKTTMQVVHRKYQRAKPL